MSKLDKFLIGVIGFLIQMPLFYCLNKFFESKGYSTLGQIGMSMLIAVAYSIGVSIRERNQ